MKQLKNELMSDDFIPSEPFCIVLPPYTPPIILRSPSPILVLGCEEALIIPDWVIDRWILDFPSFLVESKNWELDTLFCIIRDPFTFRRYPSFSVPRHHP